MTGYLTLTLDPGTRNVKFETVECGTRPSLSKMQDVVGGNIETVTTIPSPFRPGHYITLYANETALLCAEPVCMAYVRDRHGLRQVFGEGIVIVGLRASDGETVLLSAEEISAMQYVTRIIPFMGAWVFDMLRLTSARTEAGTL